MSPSPPLGDPFLGDGQGPWWLKFVYTFGIPAAVSVYLIWLMAGRVEGKIDGLHEALRAHQADTTYNVRSAEAAAKRLEDIYSILQRICVNSAPTPADRNTCFDRRPPP